MRIAVAGGTGRVGRHVVAAARAADHEVVVLARAHDVDLRTGRGVADAVTGVDVLIDVSDPATGSNRHATAFFEHAAAHLLPAEAAAGVRHHVLLSVVGCDRVPLGYYRAKQRQEELALAGPVPATVVRSTQFFEFTLQLMAMWTAPVVLAPRMRSQPIAAREVADALLGVALAPAVGRAPELAGPQERDMGALVRAVVRASRRRALVLPFRPPGRLGRAWRDGGLLPTGPGPRGRLTFEEWLTGPDSPVRAGR